MHAATPFGAGMTAEMTPTLTMSLAMRPTAEQCQFASLLALPAVDLHDAVARELEDNPALERADDGWCRGCGRSGTRWCWSCRHDRRPRPTSPEHLAVPDRVGSRPFAGSLIADYLLADLDRYGVLDRRIEAIAADLGVAVATVAAGVASLQEDQPGLAAPDITTSLHRQLDAIEADVDARNLAHVVLDEAAATIDGTPATGRLAGVAADRVERARLLIRHHLVRPAVDRAPAVDQPPPPPDVVVTLPAEGVMDTVDATDAIEVVDDPTTTLRVDTGLITNRRDGDPMLPWVRRAEQFVRVLGRRRETIEAVAGAAVVVQLAYLRRGPRHHVPLTRSEVARRLGLHESTVSRAVADKVVVTSAGATLELADLFGQRTSVVELVRQILDGPTAVGSDRELAELLAAHGQPVARRTASNYRRAAEASRRRERGFSASPAAGHDR